jgi:hypothetical protein
MYHHLQTLLDQYDAAVPKGFLQLSDLSDRLDPFLHFSPGTRDELPLLRAYPLCWICVLDAALFAVVLIQNVSHPSLQVGAPSSRH